MNKEYVQQYVQLEKQHWWFVVRQKIILSFLKKYTKDLPVRVLNIGAAGGASSQWLSKFGAVVSVETELSFIDYLRSKHIEVVDASIVNMPFDDNSFDLVCAFDVIEHVEDDVAAVKEMERVCKKDGVICATVPAFKMLWSNHDMVNGHYRRYTKKSFLSLFAKNAVLKNYELQYFNSLLFLPILVVRKISNLFKKGLDKNQSDFTNYKTRGILNKILRIIFAAEIPLLKFIKFPFGVSLIGIWKKQ